MDERIERQTISPACREVSDIDIRITCCFHLAPEKQRIFGRLRFTALHLLHRNVLDLQAVTPTK